MWVYKGVLKILLEVLFEEVGNWGKIGGMIVRVFFFKLGYNVKYSNVIWGRKVVYLSDYFCVWL